MNQIFNKKVLRPIVFIALALVALIVVLRLFSPEDAWICEDGRWVKHGQPANPQPTTRCQVGAVIKTKAQFDADAQKPKGTLLGITINEPKMHSTSTSPIMVKGSAKAELWTNQTMNFQVTDSQNKVLGQGTATQGAKNKQGDYAFEVTMSFKTPDTKTGFLVIAEQFKFPLQF